MPSKKKKFNYIPCQDDERIFEYFLNHRHFSKAVTIRHALKFFYEKENPSDIEAQILRYIECKKKQVDGAREVNEMRFLMKDCGVSDWEDFEAEQIMPFIRRKEQ
jgi:hypothetical protein